MKRPSGPALGMAGVAAAYVVTQLVVFDPSRALGWDEAVYLSQGRPGVEPVFFDAHRARGMPVLILPATALGADVAAVRVYLAGVSSAGLFAAFGSWVTVIGRAAPLAAAAFAFSWTALLYGSEMYPNLFAGLAAVAAVAWFVRSLEDPSRRALTSLTVAVAVLALLRPSESVSLAAGLGLALVGYRRLRALPPVAAVFGGAVLGWLPWLFEAYARWGSVAERVRVAGRRTAAAEDVNAVQQYLALADGPVAGPVESPAVAAPVMALIAVLGLAALVGVTGPRETRRPARTALLGAATMAVPYLLLVDDVQIRFLLPSYGLLCIPVALAFGAVTRRGARARQVTTMAAGVLVALWAAWHLAVATENEAALAAARTIAAEAGVALREVAAGQPCAFASEFAYPQIQVVSGCAGQRLVRRDGRTGVRTDPNALVADGVRFFFVTRASGDRVPGTWPETRPVTAADGEWTVYEYQPPAAEDGSLHSRP